MANKKIDYPAIKIIAWRYLRAFVSSFLASLGAQLALLQPEDLVLTALRAAVIAAAAAGIQALGKTIREYWAEDMSSVLNRLPF